MFFELNGDFPFSANNQCVIIDQIFSDARAEQRSNFLVTAA